MGSATNNINNGGGDDSTGGGLVPPKSSRAALQNMLNTGRLTLREGETYTLSESLVLPYGKSIVNLNGAKLLVAGVGGNIVPAIRTPNATETPVSVTATGSARTVTLTWPNHGKVAGDHVLVFWFTQDEYNGVFEILTTTTNTLTYRSYSTITTSPATGSGFAMSGVGSVTINGPGEIDQNVLGHNFTVPNLKVDHNAIFLLGVKNITLGDFTVTRGNKHSVLVQGFGNIKAENLKLYSFETGYGNTCDGLHINGPGRRVIQRNISGNCSDNLTVIALENIIDYRTSSGSIDYVYQSNIDGEGTGKEISHGNGVTGRKFKSVVIDGIRGSCGASAVGWYEAPAFSLINLEITDFSLMNVLADATLHIVQLNSSAPFGTIRLSNIKKSGTSGNNINLVSFGSATNVVNELIIDGSVCSGNYNGIEITNATFGKVELRGIDNTYGAASLFFINQAAGTIDLLVIKNCEDSGSTSGRFVRQAGTINKIEVDGFFGNGTQSLLAQSASANAGTEVSFADVRGSMLNLATFAKSAKMIIDPSVTLVTSGDLVSVSGSGNALTVYGLMGSASTTVRTLSSATATATTGNALTVSV